MERLHLFLALAYGVYLFVPLAHVFAHRAGADGAARFADGPGLWLDCQNPCNDPTHQHHHSHRPHDPAHCLICQTHALSHALLPIGLACLHATNSGHLVATKWAAVDGVPVLGSGSIRAPPAAA